MAKAPHKKMRVLKRTSFASRDAGSRRGAVGDWTAPRVSNETRAEVERLVAQDRGADLAANNWLAGSLLAAMQYNVIGEGLRPQAQVPAKELGITDEQAVELNRQFEWIFSRWAEKPDVRGHSSFGEMQMVALRTLLTYGEIVHLPVMLSESERKARALPYSLAVQAVSPLRLRTPSYLRNEADVLDGIRFDEHGMPVSYFIACPAADGSGGMLLPRDDTAEFIEVPARTLHRPNVLHLFVRRDDEQIRGESAFSNSAALYRYVDDAIRFELEGQNASAKYSLFIERSDRMSVMDGVKVELNPATGNEEYYTEVDGAMVMYGNPGEKPQMIASNRPSNNWAGLVNLGMGGAAGTWGLSRLSADRNYERVNYSSARAAQNGDWKVFNWMRGFMGRHYCQVFYEAVLEEAYLRGEWTPPKGAPDFYDARSLWTSAQWIGPARGFMDPVKEIQATVMAVDNHLVTRHEAVAEYGRDFDDMVVTLMDEHEKMKPLLGNDESLSMRGGTASPDAAPGESSGGSANKKDGDEE